MNWNDLDNNKKKNKIREILFSEIIPPIQIMTELNNDKTFILKIIDNILQKYNYLDEEQKNIIYKIIGVNKSDIDKIKNDIKNSKKVEKEELIKGERKENDKNNKINENKEINGNFNEKNYINDNDYTHI